MQHFVFKDVSEHMDNKALVCNFCHLFLFLGMPERISTCECVEMIKAILCLPTKKMLSFNLCIRTSHTCMHHRSGAFIPRAWCCFHHFDKWYFSVADASDHSCSIIRGEYIVGLRNSCQVLCWHLCMLSSTCLWIWSIPQSYLIGLRPDFIPKQ